MRRILLPCTALLLALLPHAAHAFQIDASSVMALCNVLPCSGGGGGAAGLSDYILEKIVTAMEVIIVAIAIISLFITAAQMVAHSTEESTVKDTRTSYIHIITGLAVVGLCRWFVLAFSAPNTGAQLVNTDVVESGLVNIVMYFKMIISLSLMVNIVVQAFRLITSQGAQEQVDKAKTRFIASFIGAGIMMLANVIVLSVIPGYGGSTDLAVEIAGIANYILVIMGFLSLLAIIVAGVLLIVSIDEGLRDKAKNMIKTSMIALIVVLTSYALVTAFILI